MNFFRYVLILAAFVLMVGCASEDQTSITYTTVSNETSLRFDTEKLVGAWVDMWNTYDLSQVDKLFLTTEVTIVYTPTDDGYRIVHMHFAGYEETPQ